MRNASTARLTRLVALASVMVPLGCDASLVSVGAWVPDSTQQLEARDASLADVPMNPPPDATDAGAAEEDAAVEPPDEPPAGQGIWLEAESGQLSGGFTIGDDPTASGGQFIASPAGVQSDNQPGGARALYEFDINTPGTFVVWGRLHTPDSNHNRFWIQIDEGTWYLWRLTTGDIWYWSPFHDNTNYFVALKFDLTMGHHQILVANAIEKTQLDRIYITPSGGERPQQVDSPCQPPNSIQVGGVCVPSCGSLGGMQCGGPGCANRTVIATHVYDCVICCL